MIITTHFANVPVELETNGFDGRIDIDHLTSIDYQNLFGEAVTVSALLNKVGLLRAEAEKAVAEKKLEKDIYEADRKKFYRRQAQKNGGKFFFDDDEIKMSEKALEEVILLDEDYQQLSCELIEAQKNFAILDTLQWSVQDKSRKLNNLLKPVTPAEFLQELVEGEVNSFLIRKKGF